MVCSASALGCTEKVSTAPDLGFLEIDPRTIEVLIPFEDFVDSVQVFGGYGSSADVGRGFVADDFGGLNARTLLYIDDYPTSSAILPGNLTFFDGRIVLFFDTLRGNLDSPADVEVFKVDEEWHPPSVTWEMVVDTAGDQTAWSQPGGGVTTLLGGGTYDVTDGEDALTDSLSIPIDSATVVLLGQPNSEAPVGLLIAGAEPGVFLNLLDVVVRLTVTAANVPDSIFEETVPIVSMSYISDPAAPTGGMFRCSGRD